MPESKLCKICGTESETLATPPGYDGIHQRCPRCGEFKISGSAFAMIPDGDQDAQTKLSGWVRNQNLLGDIPEISSDQIPLIRAVPIPGIVERVNRLLEVAIRQQTRLGEQFNIKNPAFVAATYSENLEEVMALAIFLQDQGLIGLITMDGEAQVTPTGFMRYDALRGRQPDSAQGFVAMWFDGALESAYLNGFEPAIRSAGYDPLRVDRVEHVGKIDDEIIAQIRMSRFVVADFTGQRGGVYFEAGFAQGLGLPVVWTCRREEIDHLHFDIRQYNCIAWSEPGELAQRLRRRIEAVIGAGPRKPSLQ